MSSFIRSVVTGACALASVFTLSAATVDITAAVRSAGKASYQMVSGSVTYGSMANAFDGGDVWASHNGCCFTASGDKSELVVPTEDNPVVFDFIIDPTYADGAPVVVSRIKLSGCNNYWYKSQNKGFDFQPLCPKAFKFYGSADGSNWTLLYVYDGTGKWLPENGNHLFCVIPSERRGNYHHYRFEIDKVAGTPTDPNGTVFIQNLALFADQTYYAKPDGADENDGLTWATATSLTNAYAKANADHFYEVHLQEGTYLLPKGLPSTKIIAVLGGYAGTGDNPDAVVGHSTLDAQGTIGTVFSNGTRPAENYTYGYFQTYENLIITRATENAISHSTGHSSLCVRNCKFISNRGARNVTQNNNTRQEGGRGIYISTGQTGGLLICTGCEFIDNGLGEASTYKSTYDGTGCLLSNATGVFDDCLFASNGIPQSAPAGVIGGIGMSGHAISGAKVLATNCRFIRNRGVTGWNGQWPGNANNVRGATVYATGSGSVFDRCLFVGNENLASASSPNQKGDRGTLTVTGNATVQNCTFAYNIADAGTGSGGLTVNGGTTKVSNTVFFGNFTGGMTAAGVGADVHVAAAGALEIDHSLVSSASSMTAAEPDDIQPGEGMVYDDARFVTDLETAASCKKASGLASYDPAAEETTANFDVHLLTPAGYRKNGDATWYTEAKFTSPAIDAGEGDYTNEPAPNGGVRNAGYYGNTEEASKTAEKPHFALGEIPLQFYDGVNPCRPVPTITDLDTGLEVPADECSWRFKFEYSNNTAPGTAVVTVTGLPDGGYEGQSVSANFAVAARFHVTNDATDEGTGLSWSSPMTLAKAIASVTRPTDEILMKAGTYAVTESVVVPQPVTIRGGYAGTDDVTLADDPESVLDGGGTLEADAVLKVTAASSASDAVTLERLAVVRGGKGGLKKTGTTSLVMRDCRLENNGSPNVKDVTVYGIGAYLEGTAGATAVRMVNCRVVANRDTRGQYRDVFGHGLYCTNLRVLQLEGCAFVSNGIPAGSTGQSFGRKEQGFAIFANTAPIVASNTVFRANRGFGRGESGYPYGGIIWAQGNGDGTRFDHCLFAGNSSYAKDSFAGMKDGCVMIEFDTAARTAEFDFCTFLGNAFDTTTSAAALTLVKGAFTLSNSVFAHNVVGTYCSVGADVHLAAGTLDVSDTIFGGEGEGWVSAADTGATITGLDNEDVQFGDALTVTTGEDVLGHLSGEGDKAFPKSTSPLDYKSADMNAIADYDAHLLSAEGYRRNGADAWFTDTTQVSPAIDAADEDAPYENEPDPNGERANLGFYGNTEEAAKTASGTVEIPNDVDVTYPDGYSQPKISFMLGGEGAYSATIVVTVSTNGAPVYDEKLVGKANGDLVEVLVPYYLNTGAQMDVHVDALTAGGSASQDYAKTVTAPEPPWIGKKGPPNVIHVRPGATGKNDGTSWTDAFADFHAALDQLAATDGKDELWLAGTNVCSALTVSVSFSKPVAIRGGFDGHECAADERYAGARGAVDGNLKYATLAFANGAAAPVTVERVDFLRSSDAGVVKSGAGALTMTDCDIVECGHKVQKRNGYGLSASGTAETTVLKLVNCRFEANGIPHKNLTLADYHDAGTGFGAYFANLKAVELDGCLFFANGVPFAQPDSYNPGWRNMEGSAIYASAAAVAAKNCRFVANRSYTASGGTVVLTAGCGGSSFVNCAWVGNQNQNGNSGALAASGAAGDLRLELGAGETADVENCTFAANLNDISTGSGGAVNVRSGTVNVSSCVFAGNLVGQNRTSGGTDFGVAAGATANVSYTIFPSDSSDCVWSAEGATLNSGKGMLYGNAFLASPVSPLRYMVQYYNKGAHYALGSLDFFKAFNVHLRGKKGYFDETLNREVKWPENSPAIDAGDPASSCGSEPHPNGHRVNMGFYGNTAYATKCARSGLAIVIDGGLAPTPPPKPKEHKFPVEDVVVCDQADQAIKIYHGTDCVWTWKGSSAADIPSGSRGKFGGNVAECKPMNGNRWIGMTANSGGWAIVDRETKAVVAWGETAGYPHSIELLDGGVVAIASTDTATADQHNKGVYLYDISAGGKATNGRQFAIDNPHGFYWDAAAKRLYVTDTYRLNRCTVGYAGGEFSLAVEASWAIAPLGLTYAHDLMHVPGTTQLVMTTYEKVVYFDMEKEAWVPEKAFYCSDTKCADPAPDGWKLLLSIPQTSWITDTLIVYTPEYGFEDYVTLPGAKMYKARWMPVE